MNILRRIVAPALITLLAFAAGTGPAAAYTIENPDPTTIVIHSERLDVKTIHATIHVAILRDAPDQWWVEAHNGGAHSKSFTMQCTVKFATLYTQYTYKTGGLDIPSRRSHDGYKNFYSPVPGTQQYRDNPVPDITADRFDNLVRDGFQVSCNLHNGSAF